MVKTIINNKYCKIKIENAESIRLLYMTYGYNDLKTII